MSYSTCTHVLEIEVGNIVLIPASRSDALETSADIVVSLGVKIDLTNPVSWSGKKSDVTTALMVPEAEYLYINWPDMDVPHRLTRPWWEAFMTWLHSFEEPTTIVMHCHGGHGRTGTALAIILGLIYEEEGNFDDIKNLEDIVKWVQTNYCDHAIETYSQVDYISKILGKEQKGWVKYTPPKPKSVHTPYYPPTSPTSPRLPQQSNATLFDNQNYLTGVLTGKPIGSEYDTDEDDEAVETEMLKAYGYELDEEGNWIDVLHPADGDDDGLLTKGQ